MNWYFELKKKWLSDAVATTIIWLEFSFTLNTNYLFDSYIDLDLSNITSFSGTLPILYEIDPLIDVDEVYMYSTSLTLETIADLEVEASSLLINTENAILPLLIDDELDFYLDPHLSVVLPYNLLLSVDDYLSISPEIDIDSAYIFNLILEYLPNIDSNISFSSDTVYPFALTLSYKTLPTIEITFGEPDFDEMNIILDYYYNLGTYIGEINVLYSVSTGILEYVSYPVENILDLDLTYTSNLYLTDVELKNKYLIDIYAELDHIAYPQLYVEVNGLSLEDIAIDHVTTKPFSAKFPVVVLPINVITTYIDISNLSELSGFTLSIPYLIGTYLPGIDISNPLNFTTNELTYKYSIDIDLSAVLGSPLIFSDLTGWIVSDLTGLKFSDLYYKL